MKTKITPESVLQQIAQIQLMERGKLSIIRQGPEGPYYNHQTWEKGKNVSRYVPRNQVPSFEQAIAGYEQFQKLTEQYAQMVIDRTRAERDSAFKKRIVALDSSSPKIRKSDK